MKKKLKKIEVLWHDSAGLPTEWMEEKELFELSEKKYNALVSSVGYLVKETKNYIIIATDCDNDGEEVCYNSVSYIIKTGIVKIKHL